MSTSGGFILTGVYVGVVPSIWPFGGPAESTEHIEQAESGSTEHIEGTHEHMSGDGNGNGNMGTETGNGEGKGDGKGDVNTSAEQTEGDISLFPGTKRGYSS
jgi:hypothetical protein